MKGQKASHESIGMAEPSRPVSSLLTILMSARSIAEDTPAIHATITHIGLALSGVMSAKSWLGRKCSDANRLSTDVRSAVAGSSSGCALVLILVAPRTFGGVYQASVASAPRCRRATGSIPQYPPDDPIVDLVSRDGNAVA